LAKDRFYGWTLLAALWGVMFLNLGFPAYGPAVINAAMARAVGLSRETLGDMFSVYVIMSGLPGPLVALGVNRYGVRRTLVAGSAVIILGALLMATVVTTGFGAVLCAGLLVGGGVATGGALASQAGLARWFVRRRSLALSVLYSSGAIGGFVAAPLLNHLIHATGSWRAGWWLIGAGSALAALIALLFVRERPEDLGQTADGAAAADGRPQHDAGAPPFISRHAWTFREAVGQPAFWLLLGSLLGTSGGFSMFMAHGVVHLQDLGHSAGVAAWAVSLMTVSALIAKVIIATLGDRIDPRLIWAAFTVVFGVGLLLVVNAGALWQVIVFAVCLGIGFGGSLVCAMAVLGNYYGTRVFASLAGLVVAVNTTASALAPKVAGRLYDRGVGYEGTFYFLAAACFASACVLFFMHRPVPRKAAVLSPA
jgi:MFS family permease